jgi:hypothetical protein
MKSSVRKKFTTPVSCVAALLLCTPGTQAGILSILKGDAGKPQPYQKVGFVGCAEVKEVKGQVQYLRGIEKWQPLKAGSHLSEGDLVRCENGEATLKMCESSSLVRVKQQTMLRLLTCEKDWDRGVLSGTEQRKGYVVRSLRGHAWVRNEEDSKWKGIEVNDVLPEGAVIKTRGSTAIQFFCTEELTVLRVATPGEVRLSSGLAQNASEPPSLAAAGGR